MEGVIALIMIFGMPVFIVGINKYFKFRTRRLELEAAGADSRPLVALENERRLLEQRVQNLETVVTSVDFELNARLNRLAAHQSQLLLAAPAAVAGATAAAPALAAVAPVAPRSGAPATAASPLETAPTMVAQASMGELPSGSTLLNRFEVKRTIGRGGMGAVYLAHDRQLGEEVALKVIAQNLAEDPMSAERFRREVGAARKITHPNVIRIHDLGDDSGLIFLTMEYFPGETLQQLLARGPLSLERARALLMPICDALQAAHNAGVVHRDLKPLNILVDDRRNVRVIDFGLAKASYMTSATATGMILGTPEFMAPEQVRGQAVDHRTDLYALALVAFTMLSGKPPFQAETPIAVGFMQCSQPPPRLCELLPGLPGSVDEAIAKGLSKEPSGRFDSAAAFKQAIC